MTVALELKKFLKKKLDKKKFTRDDFCNKCLIRNSTVSRLINASIINPKFMTLVKIADFFNVAIDEIIGRKKYIDVNKTECCFIKLSQNDISSNLKNYLTMSLEECGINAYKLEKLSGLGNSTIFNFLNGNKNVQIMSSHSIITIANYFGISVDDMIGRNEIKK